MKLAAWKNWSITGRLITIAVVPATMMFIVISSAFYFSGRDEIRTDIKERGNLLAAALAESTQYAVVTGNTAPLNETLRGLLAADATLIAIEILDSKRAPLVSVGDINTKLPELQVFEQPLRAQVPIVNVFDKSGMPHVSSPVEKSAQFGAGEAAGYVRVIVSALPLLEAKRERVYWTLAAVLLTALLSGVAGLYLAQRLRQPLSMVMTALRGIREGNYQVRLNPTEGGELGELQTTIVEMSKGLNTTRQELEDQVAARTSALQTAIEAVREADDEKRRLIAQGNALVEEERQRIAMEIHDHLNASLIFLKLQAQRITALAAKRADDDAREIENIGKRMSATTADLYVSARSISKQLRPEVIDTLGLRGAIQEVVRNYDLAHPNCRFAFQDEDDFPQLSPQLTIAAYRVVQEALANVVKHADATRATVTLSRNRATVCISIEDDGKGFNAETRAASGIGLIGMRERITAAGGSIKVTSSPGAGTKVTIELPSPK